MSLQPIIPLIAALGFVIIAITIAFLMHKMKKTMSQFGQKKVSQRGRWICHHPGTEHVKKGKYKLYVGGLARERLLLMPATAVVESKDDLWIRHRDDDTGIVTTTSATKHTMFVHDGGPKVKWKAIVMLPPGDTGREGKGGLTSTVIVKRHGDGDGHVLRIQQEATTIGKSMSAYVASMTSIAPSSPSVNCNDILHSVTTNACALLIARPSVSTALVFQWESEGSANSSFESLEEMW